MLRSPGSVPQSEQSGAENDRCGDPMGGNPVAEAILVAPAWEVGHRALGHHKLAYSKTGGDMGGQLRYSAMEGIVVSLCHSG